MLELLAGHLDILERKRLADRIEAAGVGKQAQNAKLCAASPTSRTKSCK